MGLKVLKLAGPGWPWEISMVMGSSISLSRCDVVDIVTLHGGERGNIIIWKR
jgi:hypothetical protein